MQLHLKLKAGGHKKLKNYKLVIIIKKKGIKSNFVAKVGNVFPIEGVRKTVLCFNKKKLLPSLNEGVVVHKTLYKKLHIKQQC